MSTYKFPQFKVEITNPTIQIESVIDSIKEKTCNVSALLITENAKFGIILTGFTYIKTWSDTSIESWVTTKLQEYEI